jgi:hypothetical protein
MQWLVPAWPALWCFRCGLPPDGVRRPAPGRAGYARRRRSGRSSSRDWPAHGRIAPGAASGFDASRRWWWLRPVVLAPVSALRGLPAEQVETLLAYELAHILHNHYLIDLLQDMAEAMLL